MKNLRQDFELERKLMQEHIEHMSQSSNSFSKLKEVSKSLLKKSSKVNSNEDLRQSKKYSVSNTNKEMNFTGVSQKVLKTLKAGDESPSLSNSLKGQESPKENIPLEPQPILSTGLIPRSSQKLLVPNNNRKSVKAIIKKAVSPKEKPNLIMRLDSKPFSDD